MAFGAQQESKFSLIHFILKHWYVVILILVLLPTVITSIRTAVKDNNPMYPVFQLGTQLLTADAVLNHDVQQYKDNPQEMIGVEKPEHGIWKSFVYYWNFFWNVIWQILSSVWLIFFPFVCIYNLVKMKNTGETFKNIMYSGLFFLAYLFVVNAIILIHGLVAGNSFIQIPTGLNKFQEYYYLFIQVLPFHGLYNLGDLIVRFVMYG